MTTNLTTSRPRWELADILHRFQSRFEAKHFVTRHQLILMERIKDCRTAALGGHLEKCNTCDFSRPVYNSCRDRHCPKCQTITKERWLAARKSELLPVPYFHKVFTIPHELNRLTLSNKKVMLNILFSSVSETLKEFGRNPRNRLGGTVGFTLILHTWNQKLLDHFHLHCVIAGGALSPDEKKWIAAKNPDYLFCVEALAKMFRGKFISKLRTAYDQGKLNFSRSLKDFSHPVYFQNFIEQIQNKNWVVYSKAPFGGPEKVLSYLGRYTHRIAISNHRITNVTDDDVSFSYRDRRDNNTEKNITVSGEEFIRRFLLHSIPKGFTRIRHYGILASRKKQIALAACRKSLGVVAEKIDKKMPKSTLELLREISGIDILKCRECKIGKMIEERKIKKLIFRMPINHKIHGNTC